MTTILAPPTSTLPKLLPAKFIVIGGGVSGLTTAYALARSGHRVTVLEKDGFDNTDYDGACRMAPNMSKIFFRWGLEDRVREFALKSDILRCYCYETAECIGVQVWQKDYLDETGGDFVFASYSNLREFVHQLCTELGVIVRPNAEVTSIHAETTSVVLASGERLSADVLVGADGADGISRATVLRGGPDEGTPLNYVLYECIIPHEVVSEDQGLLELHNTACIDFMLGNLHAAIRTPLGANGGIGLHVYAPDQGIASPPTLTEIHSATKAMQGRLRKGLDSATMITRKTIEERPELENWVHDDCPLILVGNAAHAMPAGAFQSSPVATEDAATLGKLFSHLSSFDQIRPFLYAFQDLRQPRVVKIKRIEFENIRELTLEDGEYRSMRDESMRQNLAQGLNMFGRHDVASESWERNQEMFDYDGEEAADNWWIRWGVLRERAKELAKEAGVSSVSM